MRLQIKLLRYLARARIALSHPLILGGVRSGATARCAFRGLGLLFSSLLLLVRRSDLRLAPLNVKHVHARGDADDLARTVDVRRDDCLLNVKHDRDSDLIMVV